MTQNGKIGILIVSVALFLYFYLIPVGIKQLGVEWKAGIGVLKDIALSARLFPVILTVVIGFFGGLLIITDLPRNKKVLEKTSQSKMEIRYRTLVIMGILATYYFLLSTIGYLYATVPTVGILMYCFGMKSWLKIMAVAVTLPFLLYLVIEKIMLVPLPSGMVPVFP